MVQTPKNDRATRHDIARLFGDLSDQYVAEILAAGATMEALEEAAAYLFGETDGVSRARIALTGAAATVHDIVVRDPRFASPER